MKFLKLTVCIALFALSATSCKKEVENRVSKKDLIVMNGAQVAPANQSAASAQLGVVYQSRVKTLDYLVVWTGLTGNVAAIHVHGPADPGFPAPILQTLSGVPTARTGSIKASLFVDGVVIKEEELLTGKYYVDIHTVGAFAASGEVRGQIIFD